MKKTYVDHMRFESQSYVTFLSDKMMSDKPGFGIVG